MDRYRPNYVYWELSNYCNLRCKHCFAEAGSDKNSIVDELLLYSTIKKMNSFNNFAIRFGGGEPLMVPYIFRLIRCCKDLDIKVDITTNGTLLSDGVLGKLCSEGLRELTISIDGLEQSHDYIRGPGNYVRTRQALVNAISYGKLSLSVAFTVTSKNYAEIEKFIDEFSALGIKKFYLFRYCPNTNSDLLSLSSEQLCNVAECIFRLSKKYSNITIIHEAFSFYDHQWYTGGIFKEGCNFLNNVLTIDYRGNVVVCAAIKKVLGNVYINSIDSIYSTVAAEKLLIAQIPEGCKECVHSNLCHGGCKSYSYLVKGNYCEKDFLCYFHLINKK